MTNSTTDRYVVSVERVIPAPPDAVFELLADPGKHPAIDGSGTVRQAKGNPERLSLGATFGMSMRIGLPYSMVNQVVEFEEGRRIAWMARPPGAMGRIAGGRVWRYELEAVDGSTRVRESWDLSKDKQRLLLRMGPLPRQTRRSMEKTLQTIEQVLAGRHQR